MYYLKSLQLTRTFYLWIHCASMKRSVNYVITVINLQDLTIAHNVAIVILEWITIVLGQ